MVLVALVAIAYVLGVANEFSDWLDGRATKAAMSTFDRGVAESRRCVG
jgi:Tfp pilus assembly protein FimT